MFFEACGNTREVFGLVEEALDSIALIVERGAEAAVPLPVGFGWNVRGVALMFCSAENRWRVARRMSLTTFSAGSLPLPDFNTRYLFHRR